MRSASRVSGIPKLCTCRVSRPAPRKEMETSSFATYLTAFTFVAGVCPTAMRPTPEIVAEVLMGK